MSEIDKRSASSLSAGPYLSPAFQKNVMRNRRTMADGRNGSFTLGERSEPLRVLKTSAP